MVQVDQTRLDAAAIAFQRMEETARNEQAPLYEQLSARIATDPELLEMAALARPNQSMAYMLYYTVHYLLLGGAQHELRRFYASLTEEPLDSAEAYPVFRDFCLEHADEIRRHIPAHNVQTNEVGRMAALLPGISEAARRGGDRPLGIVEVGPAAGLNLCFDRYFFDYGRVQWGDASSPVQIRCRLEDDGTPPLQSGRPVVAYRIGLDLEPIDVTDDEAARWTMAATWPDHRDLALTQRRAFEVVRLDPPKIVQGDALTVGRLLDEIPVDLTLCAYQSMMLNQLPEEKRAMFLDILAAHAEKRPLFFVSMLGAGRSARRSRVDLHSWTNGGHESQQLVEAHSHGRSLTWLG